MVESQGLVSTISRLLSILGKMFPVKYVEKSGASSLIVFKISTVVVNCILDSFLSTVVVNCILDGVLSTVVVNCVSGGVLSIVKLIVF